MNKETEARYYLAKFQALANAAEMIRGHGEEGHSFECDKFNRKYLSEAKKTAEELNRRAEKFMQKYQELGIKIDCTISDESFV